jgi:hypothetical protein
MTDCTSKNHKYQRGARFKKEHAMVEGEARHAPSTLPVSSAGFAHRKLTEKQKTGADLDANEDVGGGTDGGAIFPATRVGNWEEWRRYAHAHAHAHAEEKTKEEMKNEE